MILSGSNALTGQVNDFNISVDQGTWDKWGFEYPVTYVFHVPNISPQTTVLRRDSEPWKPLKRKTCDDFFSGVQCVRFEKAQGKVTCPHEGLSRANRRTRSTISCPTLNVSRN